MAGKVYHWKHGWIPLDHEAVQSKEHKTDDLRPVAADHLPRQGHIVAAHRNGHFALSDTQTGHTAKIPEDHALEIRDRGHMILAVKEDGTLDHATPEAFAIATKARKAAEKTNDRLTPMVKAQAARHGGALEGLNNSMKTAHSLAVKLDKEVHESNGSLTRTQALDHMFDINRYTTILPDADYSKSTQEILDELRADGNTLRVKNFWNNPDNPYQGINVQVTSPSGERYELQYHTRTSQDVKKGGAHALYKRREKARSDKERDSIDKQSHALAKTIPVPPGVAGVS